MTPGMIAETGAITAPKGGRCWVCSGHIKLKWSSVGCYKYQTSGGVFIIMWSSAPLIHCTKVGLVLHSTYFFIIASKNVILHLPINSKQTETNTQKSASLRGSLDLGLFGIIFLFYGWQNSGVLTHWCTMTLLSLGWNYSQSRKFVVYILVIVVLESENNILINQTTHINNFIELKRSFSSQ